MCEFRGLSCSLFRNVDIWWAAFILYGTLPWSISQVNLTTPHKKFLCFTRCGCLSLWEKICPMLKGIGYAICIIDIYVGMFYNTVIGWAVYYFFQAVLSAGKVITNNDKFPPCIKYSVQYTTGSVDSLPWTSCGNSWNSNSSCVDLTEVRVS